MPLDGGGEGDEGGGDEGRYFISIWIEDGDGVEGQRRKSATEK